MGVLGELAERGSIVLVIGDLLTRLKRSEQTENATE
jgi:hypothetical protein